jgi:hypothetical protein
MAFSLGANTLQITAKLFAENRARLVVALQNHFGKDSNGKVVLLKGGEWKGRYNTDADDLPFRQVLFLYNT